jgi:hypothetical protein
MRGTTVIAGMRKLGISRAAVERRVEELDPSVEISEEPAVGVA